MCQNTYFQSKLSKMSKMSRKKVTKIREGQRQIYNDSKIKSKGKSAQHTGQGVILSP